MTQIATSIEQSKQLIEMGVDIETADMYWLVDKYIEPQLMALSEVERTDIGGIMAAVINTNFARKAIPAWSLSALIKVAEQAKRVNEVVLDGIERLHYVFSAHIDDGTKIHASDVQAVTAVFNAIVKLKEKNLL